MHQLVCQQSQRRKSRKSKKVKKAEKMKLSSDFANLSFNNGKQKKVKNAIFLYFTLQKCNFY